MRTLTDLIHMLLALPQVALLWTKIDNVRRRILIQGFLERGLTRAFDEWMNARSYRHLGDPLTNGWPGELGAFQLALKSGFFQFRYAFNPTEINQALQAIQAALPPVEDILKLEGVPVDEMEKREASCLIIKTNSPEATPGCDCPACAEKRHSEIDVEEDGNSRPPTVVDPNRRATPEEKAEFGAMILALLRAAKMREVLEKAARTPGETGEIIAGGRFIVERDARGNFEERLREALERRDTSGRPEDEISMPPEQPSRAAEAAKTRTELIKCAHRLTKALDDRDVPYVRTYIDLAPSKGTLQAALGFFREYGFRRLADGLVVLIKNRNPEFKEVPAPSDPSYADYLSSRAELSGDEPTAPLQKE